MIVINGEPFHSLKYELKDIKGKLGIKVSGIIKGNANFEKFSRCVESDEVIIDIPLEHLYFKATIEFGNVECDPEEDENTEYDIIYHFKKVGQAITKENFISSLAAENLKNAVNYIVIKEVLIEKGIISEEEFNEKFKQTYKENYKKLSYELIKN